MTIVVRFLGVVALATAGVFVFVDNPRAPIDWYYSCDGPVVQCLPAPITPIFIFTERNPEQGNRRTGVLTDHWPYCYDEDGSVFVVPKGFVTDFASIPNFARIYVNPTSDYVMEAAIVHDWLYAVGEAEDETGREYADSVFRYILKESGVNRVKRNIMYFFVRKGGSEAYGRSNELRIRGEVEIPQKPFYELYGKAYDPSQTDEEQLAAANSQVSNMLEVYRQPARVVASKTFDRIYEKRDSCDKFLDDYFPDRVHAALVRGEQQ